VDRHGCPRKCSGYRGARFEENLAFRIGCNEWCISQVMAKKHMLARVDYLDSSFVSSLQVKLEEERRRIDTFALVEGLLKSMDVAAAMDSHEQHLWNMRNLPKVTNMFPLHYRYLPSCLKAFCMGCGKVQAGLLFYCGGCMYAQSCGKRSQKAGWPLHRQYCSPRMGI
jgi:hypothetical protein